MDETLNLDTHYGNTPEVFLGICQDLGFKIAYEENFMAKFMDDFLPETFYLLYKDPGILLTFQTSSFGGKSGIRHAIFYYNWIPFDRNESYELLANGCYNGDGEPYVWAGSNDCRDGLRCQIEKLEKFGTFVSPWQYNPSLFLLNSNDEKTCEEEMKKGFKSGLTYIDKINRLRLSQLPEDVRANMPEIIFELNSIK